MKDTLKAYIDLTRLHFFFVWPILFCSGLFLAFQNYGGFSWLFVIKAALIGFLGFEAGLVLNDIIDRDFDRKDVEFDKLTKYWRIFGRRPISQGLISQERALVLFAALVVSTIVLVSTLSFPHSLYVLTIMFFCYLLEVFYQIKKRNESFPFAQLVGRIDFTIFPVAGYLCIGNLDVNALLFAFFFYPLAMAHLGVNDIIDVTNDRVRKLNTIPTMFGMKGTTYWILFFSIIHFIATTIFLMTLGKVAWVGFAIGLLLIAIGNYIILKGKSSISGMKALPLFHIAMLIYSLTIILEYFL